MVAIRKKAAVLSWTPHESLHLSAETRLCVARARSFCILYCHCVCLLCLSCRSPQSVGGRMKRRSAICTRLQLEKVCILQWPYVPLRLVIICPQKKVSGVARARTFLHLVFDLVYHCVCLLCLPCRSSEHPGKHLSTECGAE